MFNQAINTELGKDSIDAGIDDDIVANLKIIPRLTHNAVALVAGNFKVGDKDIIPGIENRIVELAEAIQSRALTGFNHTHKMNIVFVDIDSFRIDSWHHLNGIAGLGGFHRSLNRVARING